MARSSVEIYFRRLCEPSTPRKCCTVTRYAHRTSVPQMQAHDQAQLRPPILRPFSVKSNGVENDAGGINSEDQNWSLECYSKEAGSCCYRRPKSDFSYLRVGKYQVLASRQRTVQRECSKFRRNPVLSTLINRTERHNGVGCSPPFWRFIALSETFLFLTKPINENCKTLVLLPFP